MTAALGFNPWADRVLTALRRRFGPGAYRFDPIDPERDRWWAQCPICEAPGDHPLRIIALGSDLYEIPHGVTLLCRSGCSVTEILVQLLDRHDSSGTSAARDAVNDGVTGRVLEPRLPFRPLSAALSQEPADVNWLWEGFLAPGAVTLLAGKPKAGKSTLAFGLMRALCEEESFLDLKVERSSVLLLSEERTATLAQKAQQAAMDRVHVLMWHEARSTPWHRVVAEAADYCIEQRIGVLVIDTWDKWSGLRGDEESRAGYVLTALAPVLEAAGRGLAVLIVAHQRKAPGQAGDAVRGSNALTGGVDVIVEVDRPEAAAARTVRILNAASRFVETPERLPIDFDNGSYRLLDAKDSSLRVDRDRRRVLAQVRATPGLSSVALSEKLEMTDPTVRRRLGELEESGLVERSDGGTRNNPSLWHPASVCTIEVSPGGHGGANKTEGEAA